MDTDRYMGEDRGMSLYQWIESGEKEKIENDLVKRKDKKERGSCCCFTL